MMTFAATPHDSMRRQSAAYADAVVIGVASIAGRKDVIPLDVTMAGE